MDVVRSFSTGLQELRWRGLFRPALDSLLLNCTVAFLVALVSEDHEWKHFGCEAQPEA